MPVHAWNPGTRLRCVRRRSSRTGRLTVADVLTLAAVSVVVIVISLPRLRGLALHENELDALTMLRVLGEHLSGPEVVAAPRLEDLLEREGLERRLEDTRALVDGRLLRHGYLFEVLESEAGRLVLRGWPLRHGQTGLGAFVWCREDGFFGHANEDARYSGPASPPSWPPAGDGWSSLSAAVSASSSP